MIGFIIIGLFRPYWTFNSYWTFSDYTIALASSLDPICIILVGSYSSPFAPLTLNKSNLFWKKYSIIWVYSIQHGLCFKLSIGLCHISAFIGTQLTPPALLIHLSPFQSYFSTFSAHFIPILFTCKETTHPSLTRYPLPRLLSHQARIKYPSPMYENSYNQAMYCCVNFVVEQIKTSQLYYDILINGLKCLQYV